MGEFLLVIVKRIFQNVFILLFIPTLYIGNYLGVRDRIPWPKRTGKGAEIFRIIAGTLITAALVIVAASAVGTILGV